MHSWDIVHSRNGSRHLERKWGVILCPECSATTITRALKTADTGIVHRKRLCQNGHLFATAEIVPGIEKLRGQVINWKGLLAKYRKKP